MPDLSETTSETSASGTNGGPQIEPLPWTSRLLLQAARLPWWAILLVSVIVGFGIYTLRDPNQRDILDWLADRPSFTTDELNDVVYERKTEVLLVEETLVVFDLSNQRAQVDRDDVISIEEGVLECASDAPANCLSQRGTIVTYRDFRVEDGTEPDGYVEIEGVIEEQSGGFDINLAGRETVTLADGQTRLVEHENILEQGDTDDFVLVCDRVVDSNCTNHIGQYVRFRQPYVERQALEARGDVKVRHLDDGYEITIRPNRVLERRQGILPCGDDAPPECVEVPVTYITYPERVIGVEIDTSNNQRVVRTVTQQTETISKDRILNIEMGLVECNRRADPRCQDFNGTIITATGEEFRGELTSESATQYDVILEGDSTSTEFERRDIEIEEREPPGCVVEDEGACNISLTLKDVEVGGRILEETDDAFVLETVPEKTVTVKEEEIYNTNTRTPAGCALNNIRGCNAGLWLTIIVTLTAYTTALVIGLLMGLLRVSSNPVLYHLSTFYVELIRGIPLLVLLLYFAFVISPSVRDSEIFVLWPMRKLYDVVTDAEIAILGQESFLAEATLGLAVGYGAFMAEIFRAGIESIHRGQMEAARSLGMSYFEAMRVVILPQAIRVVLPPLGNEFIAILKDSALISVLALPDLLQQGRVFITQTFQPKPTYNMVAWVYVVMTFVLSMGVRYVERRSKLP